MGTLPTGIAARCNDRTRRSCIKFSDGTPSRFEVLLDKPRRVLHSWLDMGAIGWYGKHALYLGWGIRGSWGWDPAHRRWNDQLLSLTASGLALTKLEIITVQVFTSGPWKGDGHFRRLEDATDEWVKSSPVDDELFQALYPRIVRDRCRGLLPDGFGTPAHKLEVWQGLPEMARQYIYGMNTKQNRWFQPMQRHESMTEHWSLVLAGCLYCCISMGLYKTVANTPLSAHATEDDDPEPDGSGLQQDDGGQQGDDDMSKRSVKWSNKELARIRSNCKGGFHLASTILCAQETHSTWTGVCAVSRPVQEQHAMAITMMKTRSGTREWRTTQCTGKALSHIAEVLAALSNPSVLLHMGLLSYHFGAEVCEFSSQCAQRIASSMVGYCREVMYHELLFSSATPTTSRTGSVA